MKMRTLSKILALLTIMVSAFIGYASYVVSSTEIYDPVQVSPVCYINSESNKYTTIEKALYVAGENDTADTIYVIKGASAVIKSNCILDSMDTLILPHDNTNKSTFSDDYSSATGYGDQNATTNRYCQVTISQGIEFEVNGKVYIQGNNGGVNPQGATSSTYAEIVMENNSKITLKNNAYLECIGFIKETSTTGNARIIAEANSTIYQPVSIYDWGSASSAIGKLNNSNYQLFPFNRYDIVNIRPTIEFQYGSKLTGKVHTWGNTAKNKEAEADLISVSPTSFGVMHDKSSKILWHFTDSSSLTSTSSSDSSHKTSVTFYGKCSLGKIATTIDTGYFGIVLDIDSSKMYLPISSTFDIFIGDENNISNVTVPYKVKMLPGSSLKISKGSRIELQSNFISYQSKSVTISGTTHSIPSYNINTPSKLINNGHLIIKSGFEGVINAEVADATTVVESNYTTVDDCYEGTGEVSIGLPIKVELTNKYGPFNWGGGTVFLLSKNYSTSNDSSYNISQVGNSTITANANYYSSTVDGSSKIGWYSDKQVKSKIKFKLTNELITEETYITNPNTSFTEFISDGSTTSLQPLTYTGSDSDKYLFAGFYYDSNYSAVVTYDSVNDLYLFDSDYAYNFIQEGNNYLTLFGRWIDNNVKKYSANIYYDTIDSNHTGKTTTTTPIQMKNNIVGSQLVFDKSKIFTKDFIVNSNSSTVTIYTLSRFVITYSSGTEYLSPDTNTIDGSITQKFSDGETINVSPEYSENSKPISFVISPSTSQLYSNTTVTFSIKPNSDSSTWLSNNGFSYKIEWGKANLSKSKYAKDLGVQSDNTYKIQFTLNSSVYVTSDDSLNVKVYINDIYLLKDYTFSFTHKDRNLI